MACCQGTIRDAQSGSNGVRFLSTPYQSMTSFRMHAPTACIFGLPAATTLVAIGDQRTVAALDVWLNSSSNWGDRVLREHVTKCRDELKQRLDKEAKEKAKSPGK